jgi:hypothetical protein
VNDELTPDKTWKGENNFSLLNIGKQLHDTNGKGGENTEKTITRKADLQTINLRNIIIKIVKKQISN